MSEKFKTSCRKKIGETFWIKLSKNTKLNGQMIVRKSKKTLLSNKCGRSWEEIKRSRRLKERRLALKFTIINITSSKVSLKREE